MDKLVVVCEGGIHRAEYLHKNKVYPNSLVLELDSVQEIMPYLCETDEVLIILSGLTDFTMASVYGVINKLEGNKNKIKSLTVMTNVSLGKVPFEYYLYTGDLFYGSVVKIVKNHKYYLDENGNVIEDLKKIKKLKNVKTNGNSIMLKYKKYNDRSARVAIYGMHKKEEINTEVVINTRDYENKVFAVDLFKNN